MMVFLVEYYPAGVLPAEVFASREEAREVATERLRGKPHWAAVVQPIVLPHAEAHADDNGRIERVTGTAD